VHASPQAVTAPLFGAGGFFLAADKVQVKYEMLRAHAVDGLAVAESARRHGYSRAAFYLVAAAFAESGMSGLLDERRGRRGPVKLTEPILEFLLAAPPQASGAALAAEVAARFGVDLHRRTIERARRR
jgi:transposase